MSVPDNTVIVFVKGGSVQWATSGENVSVNLIVMDADSDLDPGIAVWKESTGTVELEPEVQAALDEFMSDLEED